MPGPDNFKLAESFCFSRSVRPAASANTDGTGMPSDRSTEIGMCMHMTSMGGVLQDGLPG